MADDDVMFRREEKVDALLASLLFFFTDETIFLITTEFSCGLGIFIVAIGVK